MIQQIHKITIEKTSKVERLTRATVTAGDKPLWNHLAIFVKNVLVRKSSLGKERSMPQNFKAMRAILIPFRASKSAFRAILLQFLTNLFTL